MKLQLIEIKEEIDKISVICGDCDTVLSNQSNNRENWA